MIWITCSTALMFLGSCKAHQHFIVSYVSYTHGWPHPFFDRYSNTLLASLNNRISTRAAPEARGVVIDLQVVTIPDRAGSEATIDTIILETVKPQEDLMKQPVVEIEAEERVNSESCDPHSKVLFFMPRAGLATVDNVWCRLYELVMLSMVCKLLFANSDASKRRSLFYLSVMISVQSIGCVVRSFLFTVLQSGLVHHYGIN